jgi:hypothetical protein
MQFIYLFLFYFILFFFFFRNLSNTAELQRLGNGLSELMMSSSGEGMKGAIVIDLLTALCRMVFGPDPHDSLKDARKACNIIFQSIIRKQLAAVKVETGSEYLFFFFNMLKSKTHSSMV